MCLIGMTSRAKPAKSSDLQKKTDHDQFCKPFSYHYYDQDRCKWRQRLQFSQNDQFRKKLPTQLVTFHDKMDFISVLKASLKHIFTKKGEIFVQLFNPSHHLPFNDIIILKNKVK